MSKTDLLAYLFSVRFLAKNDFKLVVARRQRGHLYFKKADEFVCITYL